MIITLCLIGLTVLLSIRGFSNDEIQYKWIFNPYQVYTNKEYYRFLSSGFIHSDYMHLILNMIALYFFGKVIEANFSFIYGDVLGIVFYLSLYIGGIIVSDIPSYLKYKYQPGYNSLGASGGVAAVLFGAILYRPLSDICLYGIICMPAFILGTLYLIYSYFSGRNTNDNINHDAHLFGALFGLILTIALNPPIVVGFFNEIKKFTLF